MGARQWIAAVAAGVALVSFSGCSSEGSSPAPASTTTPETPAPEVPVSVGVEEVRAAFEASGDDYEYAQLTDDPTLEFDPDELGAVEAGQIDFMMDCGVSTIEVYVFADEAAAEAAAEEMEAQIEAFSCGAPDDSGDVDLTDLFVGVNDHVVAVSESTSYVSDFEDLDLSADTDAR